MQRSIQDPWSPLSGGRLSPSLSEIALEANYNDDADDELTTSEDMSTDVTSDSQDPRPRSPTRSDRASVYSYSSSVEHLTRDVHGRILNNLNDSYMLPADVDEHGRLDLQHEMLKIAMDGIFVNADVSRRALASKDGKTSAALDIGTGSGSWVVDCAKTFPEAEVVGIDLAPANLQAPPPPNARFECEDAGLGLTHYRNSFDVVHVRACCTGFENYRGFLDDILQVLRPGGTYQMIEGNLRLYDENHQRIPPQQENDPNFSWTVKMSHAAHEAMTARGNGIHAYEQVYGWLKEMGPVWEEVGEKDLWTPIGPWLKNDEKERIVGEMNRQNYMRLLTSFRPLLLSYGYFDETVDKWILKAHEELMELKVTLYIRWHCAWAVKSRS